MTARVSGGAARERRHQALAWESAREAERACLPAGTWVWLSAHMPYTHPALPSCLRPRRGRRGCRYVQGRPRRPQDAGRRDRLRCARRRLRERAGTPACPHCHLAFGGLRSREAAPHAGRPGPTPPAPSSPKLGCWKQGWPHSDRFHLFPSRAAGLLRYCDARIPATVLRSAYKIVSGAVAGGALACWAQGQPSPSKDPGAGFAAATHGRLPSPARPHTVVSTYAAAPLQQVFDIPFNSANKWAITVTQCPGNPSEPQAARPGGSRAGATWEAWAQPAGSRPAMRGS